MQKIKLMFATALLLLASSAFVCQDSSCLSDYRQPDCFWTVNYNGTSEVGTGPWEITVRPSWAGNISISHCTSINHIWLAGCVDIY